MYIFRYVYIYIYIYICVCVCVSVCKSNAMTVVVGNLKAHFSIATTPGRRGGRYFFPWNATHYP